MKIIFMGTPDFAAGILKALVGAGHEILLAVTKEDKKAGRGSKINLSPVKEYALEHGIEVYQPKNLKDGEAVSILKGYPADLYIVAAYGKILPKEVLCLPKLFCLNVHASLLPKYRGAAPIQRAVINGDKKTGVTLMKMDEGLDTGDILDSMEVEISEEETGESLFDKLEEKGALFLVDYLKKLEKGTQKESITQDDALATYAPMLRKKDGNLDFSKGVLELERLIRGLYSWPGAYTFYKGKLIKVFKGEPINSGSYDESLSPGAVAGADKEIVIRAGDGFLKIKELQMEGKKRMGAEEFLRGFRLEKGDILGQQV